MLQRYIHERALGKYARDLAAEAGVEPVVVADMQKPAAREILTEALGFPVAQLDVPVAGNVEERIVPQPIIEQRDARLTPFDGQGRPLRDCLEQIRNARRVGVPVAAAVILQARDGES